MIKKKLKIQRISKFQQCKKNTITLYLVVYLLKSKRLFNLFLKINRIILLIKRILSLIAK
jgi:hypothetical protein